MLDVEFVLLVILNSILVRSNLGLKLNKKNRKNYKNSIQEVKDEIINIRCVIER